MLPAMGTNPSPADQVEDLACHPDAFDELKRGDAVTMVHRKVTDALEPAIMQILSLSANASNERLKFDASKYILELGLPKNDGNDAQSPIEKLIAEIHEAADSIPEPAPRVPNHIGLRPASDSPFTPDNRI